MRGGMREPPAGARDVWRGAVRHAWWAAAPRRAQRISGSTGLVTIMRAWLPLLALVVLLIPAAQSSGGATEEANLQWLVPDSARAGVPVHAAYMIVESDDPLQLRGHVDVRVEVWLDDELLWESDSLHEHDGLHTLAVAPPRPGTLRVVAQPKGQEAVEATVPVASADSSRLAEVSLQASDDVALVNITLEAAEGMAALWDLRDSSGRLHSSHWAGAGQAVHVRHGARDAALAVLVHGTQQGPPGLVHLDGTLPAQEQGLTGSFPDPTVAAAAWPDCRDAGIQVVLDPNPAANVGGTPVWQEWTDLRVSAPDTTGPVRYWLEGASGPDARTVRNVTVPGPANEWTTRTDLGPQSLYAETIAGTCKRDLVITPGLAAEGHLDAGLQTGDGSAAVVLRAVGPDGKPLAHYEFDTRVWRNDTADQPGRLVWKGKLHGHAGEAAFTAHGLEPGRYTMQVYPSPQDAGTPPLATDDPDGFRYTFQVEAADTQESADAAQEDASFAPLALVALAVLAATLRGRTR